MISNRLTAWNESGLNSLVVLTILHRCMFPGLSLTATGSGEINGTKYMNSAMGLPGDPARPASSDGVGPVGPRTVAPGTFAPDAAKGSANR